MTFREFREWCDDESVSLGVALELLDALVEAGDVSEMDADRWAMTNLEDE